ncbi:MAG TPA: hydroxyacylglutathione hydrolase [Burkholderiaceae bacterium]|nr:hydroxyacylglutathione hydrolase [Burkholderiaceae bacterium]
MDLAPLPAFTDNYIWMLRDGHCAVVVDPGDAAPVRAALAERQLRLVGILVTHHHADHVGGLAELLPLLEGPIYGPAAEALPVAVRGLRGGDEISLLGLRLQVLDVPGHTAGHIAYLAAPPGQAPLLFCGDTLFSAGCGRLFEGTPAQMLASLQQLAALPGTTRVCCAHEYTLANLRFARAVEPDNSAIAQYEVLCQGLRSRSLPTLPTVIEREREVNPFLRCNEPGVIAAASAHGAASADPADVFAAIRQWKNEFR